MRTGILFEREEQVEEFIVLAEKSLEYVREIIRAAARLYELKRRREELSSIAEQIEDLFREMNAYDNDDIDAILSNYFDVVEPDLIEIGEYVKEVVGMGSTKLLEHEEKEAKLVEKFHEHSSKIRGAKSRLDRYKNRRRKKEIWRYLINGFITLLGVIIGAALMYIINNV